MSNLQLKIRIGATLHFHDLIEVATCKLQAYRSKRFSEMFINCFIGYPPGRFQKKDWEIELQSTLPEIEVTTLVVT